VHVISRKRLRQVAARHADLEEPLDAWFKRVKQAVWRSIVDVRRDFPQADAVGNCTVFNIKGNKYRLIAKISYRRGRVYIKHVLAHAEYDKGDWKNECSPYN
jgi:mRNA interferase HigB